MGLMEKIKGRLWRQPKAEQPQLADLARRNQRAHDRYNMDRCFAASLEVASPEGDLTYQVRDVSYGGLGISGKPTIPSKGQGRLVILDQTITVDFERVHDAVTVDGSPFFGLLLRHDTVETLVFLREVIENLHNGASLQRIDRTILSETYANDQWLCFRGDGPSDLKILKSTDSMSAEQILLTFRSAGLYHEIAYRKGRPLQTGTSLTQLGPSNRMDFSPQPMPKVVRQALYILNGLADEEAVARCSELTAAAHASLGLSGSVSAA